MPVYRLVVKDDLTIYTASDMKGTLLSALKDHEGLELDLSQVSEIDTSGVQLLILTKREALAAQKPCRIVAHSSAVQETIEFCNLAAFFGDPMIISAGEQG